VRDYALYLKDIFQAIESIEVFTAGMDYATFVADDKTMSAVIRKLEIIGEAVKQLPEEIRVKHPEIPWKQIAGMRDKLVHFYFGVDAHLIWQTIHNRLPALKTAVRMELPDRSNKP
jgi:uncharacterized protein with HEPN domain